VTALERELVALREEIAWPPTPDLAGAVAARVATEAVAGKTARDLAHARAGAGAVRAGRRRAGLGRRLRLAPALAGLLVVLVAVGVLLAASDDVRARLREWLGIGAVRIERVERLPDLAPARHLGLGRRMTAAEARRRTGLPVPRVGALGPPDAVYASAEIAGGAVSLVHLARPGLPEATAGVGALLSVFRGDGLAFVDKLVRGDTPIDRIRVTGARGYWVGEDHVVLFADRDGVVAEQPARLAASTLLWVRGGVTYRLETALGKAAALRLARTVRVGR
jgi:hypothetical protein